MAYTFGNAKNALLRIEFEMKANNNNLLKKKKGDGKLIKKKVRKDVYEQLKGKKNIMVDISNKNLNL